MKKPKSKLLTELDDAQQAKLAEWLLSGMPYHQARELVQSDFGVRVSLSAFTSFWNEVCTPHLVTRRNRAVNTAAAVREQIEAAPGKFSEATIDALEQKAFELSISPHAKPDDVKQIFALVLKARDQDIDRAQLTLAKEKLELELQKYKDQVQERKQAITSAIEKSKTGGLTPESIALIEEQLKLL